MQASIDRLVTALVAGLLGIYVAVRRAGSWHPHMGFDDELGPKRAITEGRLVMLGERLGREQSLDTTSRLTRATTWLAVATVVLVVATIVLVYVTWKHGAA